MKNLFASTQFNGIDGNQFKNTVVISAFPATGKSYLVRNQPDLNILDSDSSTFDKENFPANYIEHIKSQLGKVDVILVSSHQEVRDALSQSNINHTLVYPNIELKDDYMERFQNEDRDAQFKDTISKLMDKINKKEGKNMISLGMTRNKNELVDAIAFSSI